MDRPTPKMRSIAEALVALESRNKSTATKPPAVFDVIERLRPHLANLMGNSGFQALLSRALALASGEVAWLGAVHVKAGGALEGVEELHSQLDPAKFLEGRIVLLAELLGLLEAFIGPNLTASLVGEIWPNFRSASWISAGGDAEVRNEKTR
jgi:hypothetical protein